MCQVFVDLADLISHSFCSLVLDKIWLIYISTTVYSSSLGAYHHFQVKRYLLTDSVMSLLRREELLWNSSSKGMKYMYMQAMKGHKNEMLWIICMPF